MAEFKLGRIKFVWQGNWSASTTYVKDDVLRYGGQTYMCVLGHTATSNFYTDLSSGNWQLVSDGSTWTGAWAISTYYKLRDVISYGGRLYICNTPHTSAATTLLGLENDQSKWDLYASSFNWVSAGWAVSTKYKVNDIVNYGANSYICNTAHTSASTTALGLENDISNWDIWVKGLAWTGNWATSYRYRINDIVLYGGISYVCNAGHTSAATASLGLENDQNKWDFLHKGITYLGTWSGSTVRYKINDVVKYGADLWICTTQHTSSAAFATANWAVWIAGLQFYNSWSSGTTYQNGDIVTYGGYQYVSNTVNTASTPSPTSSDWSIFTTGFTLLGDWVGATSYQTGNVVRLGGYTYVATLDNSIQTVTATATTNTTASNTATFVSGTTMTAAGTQTGTFSAGMTLSGGSIAANTTIVTVNTATMATASITGQSLNIAGAITGTISIGMVVTGTNISAGTYITAGSGTSWTVNQTQSGVSSVTITGKSFTISSSQAVSSTTVTGSINAITVGSTANLLPNLPLVFTGTTFGNIVATTQTYYVSTIISATQFTVSTVSGGTPFTVTTASGSMTGTTNPSPPFTGYWSRLNSGIRWNPSTQTFSALSGTNVVGSGTSATFNVIVSNTNYTVTVASGGTGYANTNTIKILGTALGGISPANDLLITVTNVSGGVIQTGGITSVGYAVSWASSTAYVAGDTVNFGSNSYICVTAHVAASGNRPDADTTGTYWNVLAVGSITNVLTTQGDTIYYGGAGPARLPIGTDGQVLRASTVGGSLTPQWAYFGVINNVVYVAPSGTDALGNGQGQTLDKPWQTVRYAALQVENGYLNTSAQLLLAKNKQFMMKEVTNFIIYNYTVTITATTGGSPGTGTNSTFTCNSTAYLSLYMPMTFTVTAGGVTAGVTYYVSNIVDATHFSVSAAYGGTTQALSATSTANTASLVYNSTKCERDVGLLVDAAVFDIGHGGNQKNTDAAKSYFNSTGNPITTTFGYQVSQSVTAYNYLKNSLFAAVLGNTAPSSNYQALNGISSGNQANQIIDNSLTAETGSLAGVQTNLSIVTTALQANSGKVLSGVLIAGTAGQLTVPSGTYTVGSSILVTGTNTGTGTITSNTIYYVMVGGTAVSTIQVTNSYANATSSPTVAGTVTAVGVGGTTTGLTFTLFPGVTVSAAQLPQTTIMAKTGNYSEILPIVVPANTAISGDELRGTVIQPAGAVAALVNDKPKSVTALLRTKALLSNLVSNTSITPTSGNTASQVTSLPAGDAGSTAAANSVINSTTLMSNIFSNGLALAPAYSFTNPTGYNTSFLVGYGDAKAQIVQNYNYIKAQISQYIYNNYLSVYNAIDVSICQRDVGYVLDALLHDMTYGGNTQTNIAGSAYYSYGVLTEAATEKTATIAAYGQLKTIIGQIATGTLVTSQTATNASITGYIVGTALNVSSTVSGTIQVGQIITGAGIASNTIVTAYNSINSNWTVSISQTVGSVGSPIAIAGAYPTQVTTGTAGSSIAGVFAQSRVQNVVDWVTNAAATSTVVTTTGSTIGPSSTTLTIGTLVSGTIAVGQLVTGAGVAAGTYITANLSGSGNGSTWTVSVSQTVASSAIGTQGAFTPNDAGTVALSSSSLQTAFNALLNKKTEIQSDTTVWVQKYFQALNFNTATCYRDAGYIVDALAYDLVLGTNFNSITVAKSYYRAITSAQTVLLNQTQAELGAIGFIGYKAKLIAASGAAAQASVMIDDIVSTIYGQVTTTATAFNSSGNVVTLASTAGVYVNMPVVFTSGSQGGTQQNQTYWVLSVNTTTNQITITATYGSVSAVTLTTAASTSVAVTIGAVVQTHGTLTYDNTLSTINGAEIIRANINFLAYESVAYVNASYGGTVSGTNSTGYLITTTGNHNFVVGDPVTFTGTVGISNIVAGNTYYVLAAGLTSTSFAVTSTQFSLVPTQVATATLGSLTVKYAYSVPACIRDTTSYLNAIVYDLNFPGNYKTQRSAQLYNNAVGGSVKENMFLLRNGTGLRNMTMTGLTGTLGAANAYGTRRPTAGSYSSLDPGFGPNDANAWIYARSPYTQNCTMFGYGCVGMKIDGALHAGGNRSIVANDYTTILSDGIGVWCTGSSSLTELVSVFCYYGYAGYLAELGGRMRATNGNSSYGTYGTLAEGGDTYEVAVTAAINNRSGQATVSNVFTDSTNAIYRMEFSNAGSGYNTATWSIGGTGYNATVVANEFRDNAVFETRPLTGGANYVTQSNVAQAGTLYQINLAATDSAISAAYIGMRILLTGGTGNGQAGYIVNYNSGTKLANVAKESFTTIVVNSCTTSVFTTTTNTSTLYANMPIYFSGASTFGGGNITPLTTVYYVIGASLSSNGTTFSVASASGSSSPVVLTSGSGTMTINAAGWDHVVPGTTNATNLDLTTTYIIEPRVVASAPGFVPSIGTQVLNSAGWADVAYGDTTVTYNSVSGTIGLGTGTLSSGSGATFSIVRTGVAYAITITTGGTLYTIGNTITIPGTSLGGVTPANNLVVTITNVNTGTGAITNFTYTGVGSGGYYVAITSNGNATQYSSDGTSWTTGGTLSSSTTWTAIAYGAGVWVAIAKGGTLSNYATTPLTWQASSAMPATANWSAIAYGNGRFMAVASGSANAAYSTVGQNWTNTNALPSGANWSGVAYGGTIWVAISGGVAGSTAAASSADGTTWTARTLPSSQNWTSVTYGKNIFVAVAASTTATAYSIDGITWKSSGAGMGVNLPWSRVKYGQGLFLAAPASQNQNITATTSITATFSGYISAVTGTSGTTGTVLTVTGSVVGTIALGMNLSGGGTQNGTYISSLGTGTGGVGTYNVSITNNVGTTGSPQAFVGVNNLITVSSTTGVVAGETFIPTAVTQTPTATATTNATATGSASTIATSVLTVGGTISGTWAVGMVVTGSASIPAGTYITSLGTGTGGAGTYNLSTTPGTVASFAATGTLNSITLSSVAGLVPGESFVTTSTQTASTVVSTAAGTSITLANSSTFDVGEPVVFTAATFNPVLLAAATGTNLLTVSSTSNLVVNQSIVFTAVTQTTTATATTSATATMTGSTIGATGILTVGTLTAGSLSIGMVLTGGSIGASVYITGNLLGSGSGSTWQTNTTTTQTSTTITGTLSSVTVGSTTGMVVGETYTSTAVTASTTATQTTTTSAVMANSSITSGILTVGTVSSGIVVIGMALSGSGVTAGTYVVANISGNGTSAGSQWAVSSSQTTNVSTTTITGTSYIVTVASNSNMVVGQSFATGSSGAFGNLANSATYYILTINSTFITISATPGGAPFVLINASGTVAITAGAALGGLVSGSTYYILTIPTSSTLTLGANYGSNPVSLINGVGSWNVTTGQTFSSVTAGTTYYITQVNSGSSTIQISATVGGSTLNLTTAAAGAWTSVAGGVLGGIVSGTQTYYVLTNNTGTGVITVATSYGGSAVTWALGAGAWAAGAGVSLGGPVATTGQVTAVGVNNGVITTTQTVSALGISVGSMIYFTNGSGTVFGGPTANTLYYVNSASTNSVTVATYSGGAGTGTAFTSWAGGTGTMNINVVSSGLITGVPYYILTVGSNYVTVGSTFGTAPVPITTSTGDSWSTACGTFFGNLVSTSTYYVQQVFSGTNQLQVSQTSTGSSFTLVSGAGGWTSTAGAATQVSASNDGINWVVQNLTSVASWPAIAFGNPSSVPLWVACSLNTTIFNKIVTGATATLRCKVSAGAISEYRLIEPGSGYSSAPLLTITDPNQTSPATQSTRVGVGAIANPMWTNRGLQYATGTATVSGNGYADSYQTTSYINISGLYVTPTAGANIQIAGNGSYYKLVQVSNLLGTGPGLAPYTAVFQISPSFTSANAPVHGSAMTLKLKYSQVRLTGHDFLSIGTGNQTTTNYPGTPLQAANPTLQTVGNGGGRVFYTSTDQDGNFQVGTLFSVQQATGVASINADAFNLAGLNSLTLGSISLGSSNATITQFSTDPYFTANSDNVVPTQKAIKSYISSQIGGGSSALNVNTLTAGVIYIAGNTISTTTQVQILVPATMNFTGAGAGINGIPLAMNFLLLN